MIYHCEILVIRATPFESVVKRLGSNVI